RKQLEVIEAMLRPARPHLRHDAPLAEEGDEREGEPAAAPARPASAAEEQQKKNLLAAAQSLDGKLAAAESKLVSKSLRDSDDKYFIEADGAYLDLIWLNAEVGTGGGDVAGGADFAPTEAQLANLRTLEGEVAAADADYQAILSRDLPALDRELEKASLATVP
ncbi:MAG: hypothetical protein KGJ68_07675, partial [Gammaproteobacteria bacterium]|nr:hypothetical protein [Gammaproteobacteria bacterium]